MEEFDEPFDDEPIEINYDGDNGERCEDCGEFLEDGFCPICDVIDY